MKNCKGFGSDDPTKYKHPKQSKQSAHPSHRVKEAAGRLEAPVAEELVVVGDGVEQLRVARHSLARIAEAL